MGRYIGENGTTNMIKRANRYNTGNRWQNKTYLVAKLDIFISNFSTNRDRIKHSVASVEIKHFSTGMLIYLMAKLDIFVFNLNTNCLIRH